MKERKTPFGTWLWRMTAFWRTSAGLAILAVAVVGLRLLWIQVQRPAHLEENAALYGSIRNFSGQAGMNHDGSQFIYVAPADDRAHALFLCDTATGKKQQLIEDKQGVGIWNDDFNCLAGPWAPDDSSFLCCVSNLPMVFSADTHQGQVVMDGQPFSETAPQTSIEAVWLTPAEFACVSDQTNLCVGQKRADGQWEEKIYLSRTVPLTSLIAINSDTVAWLENDDFICHADLSQEPPKTDAATMATNGPPTNGLALWLDASGLREADQAQVVDLPDLSANKNDAVWNGTPPVYNGVNSPGALNGQGTIHFGWLDSPAKGTGLKTRATTGIAGAMPRSVFVVMRHEANRPMMVSMGNTSSHGALFGVEWSDKLYLPTGWWADNFVSVDSTDWNLLEVLDDGMTQKGYLNGTFQAAASQRLNTADTAVEIGYRDGSDGKGAEGDFAELLVYNRSLNNAERRQVEDYLGGKWFGKKSFSPPDSLVWYKGMDGMTNLAYSKETGQLLITRTDNGEDSVWRWNPVSGVAPVQVLQGQSVRDVQWAGPDTFVYASRLDTRFWLKLADLAGHEKKQLLQLWGDGNLEWFQVTPDQKQVFMLGILDKEPVPDIYRCDLESGEWHPVISSSDYPSPLASAVEVSSRNLTLVGSSATYTFFRPANFNPHKKHPLLIGDTVISDSIYGEPFMKGVAACGACVAVVGRPYWAGGIQQWAENVQKLYDTLKNDPSIDTSQVYLFAVNAETYYCSQLVESNPAPWRGIILLTPDGPLPDFSDMPRFQPRPKVLLDTYGVEQDQDRFTQYQMDCLDLGVVVELYIHPGETYQMVGTDARLGRVKEEKRFIFQE